MSINDNQSEKMHRITGELDDAYNAKYKFLKGYFGSKNNGELFEILIDIAEPAVMRKLKQDNMDEKKN